MFKKFFIFCFAFLFSISIASAKDNIIVCYEHDQPIQKRIDEIGFKILNANKLDKHIIFVYNSRKKSEKVDSSVIKRKISVFDTDLKFAATDDELAAFLARKISASMKSFDGAFGGFIGGMQVMAAPKAYELVADKRAVEYMVKAGYNPLGLITYINKAYPQARQDKISNHNLTSKRLMYIYEKIYRDYPYFLAENSYINNSYYQNFLLNSTGNRKKLEQKVKSKETGKIKYE